jgi:hypothetical protein
MWLKKIHMPDADFNADDFFDEPKKLDSTM